MSHGNKKFKQFLIFYSDAGSSFKKDIVDCRGGGGVGDQICHRSLSGPCAGDG